MHARMVTAQVKPGSLKEVEKLVHEVLLPAAAEQRGNRGGWGLVDPSTARGMVITFWETAQDLENTECNGFLLTQLARVSKYLDGPVVRETYEVILPRP
jgi:heme-degrading monooxygenase HmoA